MLLLELAQKSASEAHQEEDTTELQLLEQNLQQMIEIHSNFQKKIKGVQSKFGNIFNEFVRDLEKVMFMYKVTSKYVNIEEDILSIPILRLKEYPKILAKFDERAAKIAIFRLDELHKSFNLN